MSYTDDETMAYIKTKDKLYTLKQDINNAEVSLVSDDDMLIDRDAAIAAGLIDKHGCIVAPRRLSKPYDKTRNLFILWYAQQCQRDGVTIVERGDVIPFVLIWFDYGKGSEREAWHDEIYIHRLNKTDQEIGDAAIAIAESTLNEVNLVYDKEMAPEAVLYSGTWNEWVFDKAHPVKRWVREGEHPDLQDVRDVKPWKWVSAPCDPEWMARNPSHPDWKNWMDECETIAQP